MLQTQGDIVKSRGIFSKNGRESQHKWVDNLSYLPGFALQRIVFDEWQINYGKLRVRARICYIMYHSLSPKRGLQECMLTFNSRLGLLKYFHILFFADFAAFTNFVLASFEVVAFEEESPRIDWRTLPEADFSLARFGLPVKGVFFLAMVKE